MLRARPNLKNKLSATLKSWLPILQSDPLEIEETLLNCAKDNPFVRVQSGISTDFSSHKFYKPPKNALGDQIERLSVRQKSLHETLNEQLLPPLFPTPMSLKIAGDIIENLSPEGYFEGDTQAQALSLGVEVADYEKVRQRFAYLDPPGVAARDLLESFAFQLTQHEELDIPTYELCAQILKDLEQHQQHRQHPLYAKAMQVITSFKNPPALDFAESLPPIVPDILVLEEDGGISVQLNEGYYPKVVLEQGKIAADNGYLKEKLKEARDLVDALQMRHQTIQKIGLMLVEYQYDFFKGGTIKPMRLVDLAEEFGYAASTISRAISNKYLACNRGVFAIKSFFATALEGDVSNAAIKEFLLELISKEDKQHPMSDLKILELVEKQFGLKMVRRTITKYRKLLNIASSTERKKLYGMALDLT
ncbi:RNA polymerase factor sigma-54 [Helicobacter heilmannii]|uniref:RNA polymerase sigma-54 factor RpoN n=1 Tax=Helicobacter heilmannii TaxID=35817 RepID=A0A0K2Y918_HELHE|nr:RNA polymerase factor sigma-54 [Helicobacter heilmannii]CCM12199.1 RNA polymerase sigma-54 factor RpoN [Helicobacter heilmannii ASB1.4]CRI34174.1 RNA polymerase sigma-54 factor RpoN [Helicobacter heilmannii]